MPNRDQFPAHRLPPRRTLNRLALALGALALGGAAQALFHQKSVTEGALLYMAAAFLFAKALGGPPAASVRLAAPYRGLFAPLSLSADRRRRVIGGLLSAAALPASGWSAALFAHPETSASAWGWYALSLVLFGAGIVAFSRYPAFQWRLSRLKWRWSSPGIILGLIIIVAALLRLWQFNTIPFGVWYDEAEAGLQARRWLTDPLFRPAFYEPINVSGQFLFLYSLALRAIADSVLGLRMVSVAFGLGSVVAAYLFGRQLKGPVFGLTLAFLLAVMRWDVNFSRIAMTGVDTPFFELVVLYFAARLLRHGRWRDAAWLGVWLGFGLSFYTAFRLFALALVAFATLGLILWPGWQARLANRRWWGRQAARLSILLLGVWLAAMPVGQYALRQSDSFWARVQMTSIVNRRDDPNLAHALQTSLGKHLAMFNLRGDNNGRHNLPGEPMLDPAMGVLLVLGFGLAARGWRRHPANTFFLLLLPAALTGGIFSLDFEAPQSLRSIAALPAVAWFCALSLSALYQEARVALRPLSNRWLFVPAGALAVYMLGFNAHTYFGRQARDFAVWNAFSTPETITARKMAQLGPNVDYFVSPFLANHPTLRFVSPDTPTPTVFNLPAALPIRTTAIRPAALFIHPDDAWVFKQAQAMYPAGQFEAVSLQPQDPPAIFTAVLSAMDVAGLQGLDLRYRPAAETDFAPQQATRVKAIDVDWAAGAPLPPPFVAEWQGILYAPAYNTYRFILDAPAASTLELDGYPVIESNGSTTADWVLPQGNHTLRLQAASGKSGDGHVRLRWQAGNAPPQPIRAENLYLASVGNHGLLGKYYPAINEAGGVAFTRIDPMLNTYFHFVPLPRPYSVEWTGMLEAPLTGIYEVGLRAVGNANLFIDDRPVVSVTAPDTPVLQPLSLQAGLHPIRVTFQDTLPRSRIHLLWRPPNAAAPEPVPAANLWPPMGAVWQPPRPAVTAESDFQAGPLSLRYVRTFSDRLVEPRDVAVDAAGRVIVADTGAKAVHIFSAQGEWLQSWPDTPDGPFEEPLAVVADAQGRVWVLDSTRQWVYGFSAEGRPAGKIGGPDAFLYHPRGLALLNGPSDSAETLAIVNTGSGQIALFDTTGAKIGQVGAFGNAPGQFNEPVDVLSDAFGAYFVTEGANSKRWQRVDPAGNSLGVWPADMPVAFDGGHLAWAPDGSVLMTNSQTGALRRFSPAGVLLDEWRTVGPITLRRPVGVFADEAGRVFVTDIGAGAVYEFQTDGAGN